MKKMISTKTHGILDYLSSGALVAMPRLLGWNQGITRLLTDCAIATVAYSLLTRYELGAVKLIPMQGHLALDSAQSLLIASSPGWFIKPEKKGALAGLLGISLFEALVVANSQTHPEKSI